MGYSHNRVFSVTPFVVLLIEELLGHPRALAELGRLGIQSVGVSSNLQTGDICQPSCQTPVLLLFDRHIFLVLLLLNVVGGEEKKFQF